MQSNKVFTSMNFDCSHPFVVMSLLEIKKVKEHTKPFHLSVQNCYTRQIFLFYSIKGYLLYGFYESRIVLLRVTLFYQIRTYQIRIYRCRIYRILLYQITYNIELPILLNSKKIESLNYR